MGWSGLGLELGLGLADHGRPEFGDAWLGSGLGFEFGFGSGFGFGFGLGAPSRMPDSTTSRTASSTLLHGPCSVLGAEREGVGALPSQVSRRRTPSECRKDGTSSSSSQSGSHTGASTGAEHERFIAVREETRRRLGPRGMRGAWWSATLEPLITSIEPASAAWRHGHGVAIAFSAVLASARNNLGS